MRKCVFAGDWLGNNVVGVQRYATQILTEIDRKMDSKNLDFDIEVLVPQEYNGNPFKNIRIVKSGHAIGKAKRILWQQMTFPKYVRKQRAIGIDLTLSIPIWGCDIVAIHDCIYEEFPENFEDHRLHRIFYLWRVKMIARKKNVKIVTVSNESKCAIQKYYDVPDDRITIIGNGWEHMKSIESDDSIFKKFPQIKENRYFFTLGSRYRHKNLQWVMEAAHKNSQYLFVATGSDAFSNEKERLDNKPTNLVYTGYVSDGEMKSLMENAIGLIQPSLYEGFGIPPVEALSLGTPIIVSNVSCLPEIYEGSAHYINPFCADVDLDDLLSEKVQSADETLKKHSWENSANEIVDLIRKVL